MAKKQKRKRRTKAEMEEARSQLRLGALPKSTKHILDDVVQSQKAWVTTENLVPLPKDYKFEFQETKPSRDVNKNTMKRYKDFVDSYKNRKSEFWVVCKNYLEITSMLLEEES